MKTIQDESSLLATNKTFNQPWPACKTPATFLACLFDQSLLVAYLGGNAIMFDPINTMPCYEI